jgi:nitroreductase
VSGGRRRGGGGIASLAAARRTHKAFGREPVPRETLLDLLALARLAPNHHLTQPWRFRVLGPATLGRLKEAAGAAEAVKLDRAATLVVASATLSGELLQDEEDVCATAAAIMLVLLGATERGLATYWRTPGVLRTARGREAIGIPAGERVLALLHFGAPVRDPSPREREPVDSYVSFLD